MTQAFTLFSFFLFNINPNRRKNDGLSVNPHMSRGFGLTRATKIDDLNNVAKKLGFP